MREVFYYWNGWKKYNSGIVTSDNTFTYTKSDGSILNIEGDKVSFNDLGVDQILNDDADYFINPQAPYGPKLFAISTSIENAELNFDWDTKTSGQTSTSTPHIEDEVTKGSVGRPLFALGVIGALAYWAWS